MADEMTDQELAEIERRVEWLPSSPWQANGVQVTGGFAPVVPIAGSAQIAEFIAHARDDVPRLLAEVRRLRALLAEQGH